MIRIPDINWLYYKYYSENPELRRIITVHSECVARKALEINKTKHLGLDPKEVYVAALLHDIGVVKCNAPGIFAHGEHPYIQHGLEGKRILEENGLKKYSRICTSHTGSGITRQEICDKKLPLPPSDDFLPKTLLEKLICYSDKFFSKSKDLTREKSLDEVEIEMNKFGQDSLERFRALHKRFS